MKHLKYILLAWITLIGPYWLILIAILSTISNIGSTYRTTTSSSNIIGTRIGSAILSIGLSYNVLFVFVIMNIGIIGMVLGFKYGIGSTIVVGNIVDIYIFGFIGVLVNGLLYAVLFGTVLLSFIFYLFLHHFQAFLCIIAGLELFSTFFQSVTLSNRLSINIFAGSLLVGLLLSGMLLGTTAIINSNITLSLIGVTSIGFLLFCIFCFEFANTFIQGFLFSVLFISYSI